MAFKKIKKTEFFNYLFPFTEKRVYQQHGYSLGFVRSMGKLLAAFSGPYLPHPSNQAIQISILIKKP